jgi:hypothetical protein
MDPEQDFTYTMNCGGGSESSSSDTSAQDIDRADEQQGYSQAEANEAGVDTSQDTSFDDATEAEIDAEDEIQNYSYATPSVPSVDDVTSSYVSNQDFSQSQPDYDFVEDQDGYGGGYSEDVANVAKVDTSMDTSYPGGIDYNTADEESQRVISDLAEQGGYGTSAVGLKGWTNNLRSNFLTNPAGFMLGTQSLLGLGILGLNATPTVIGLKDRINEKFTGVFDNVGSIFDRSTSYDPAVFNTGGDSDGGNQSDFGGIISKQINTQLPDSVAGKYYAQQHGLLGKSVMDDYQKAKASINQTTQSAGSLQQVATTANPFFDFLEANNLNRGIL